MDYSYNVKNSCYAYNVHIMKNGIIIFYNSKMLYSKFE